MAMVDFGSWDEDAAMTTVGNSLDLSDQLLRPWLCLCPSLHKLFSLFCSNFFEFWFVMLVTNFITLHFVIFDINVPSIGILFAIAIAINLL